MQFLINLFDRVEHSPPELLRLAVAALIAAGAFAYLLSRLGPALAVAG